MKWFLSSSASQASGSGNWVMENDRREIGERQHMEDFANLSEKEKKEKLFLMQKETLDLFLFNHAITEAQYQKSYGDLVKKMGMEEFLERNQRS